MHLSSNSIIKTTHYNYSKIFSNPINIGYGIDDNFARCTATSIFSFYKNNPNKNFIFHILENNLSNTYKEKFHLLANKYNNLYNKYRYFKKSTLKYYFYNSYVF